MRGLCLFIAGIAVGLAVHTALAQSSSPNHGIVGLNHVGISVPDLDKAVAYYSKTLGFPEAFRSVNDKGQTTLVYVQISRGTFLELQPANAERPAGTISHFGVVVENMADATSMFKQRGVNVAEIRVSPTKAVLSNVTTPDGTRMELLELTPQSEHRKAMERWKDR